MRAGSSAQNSLGMVMGEHMGGRRRGLRYDRSVVSVVIVCRSPYRLVEELQRGETIAVPLTD